MLTIETLRGIRDDVLRLPAVAFVGVVLLVQAGALAAIAIVVAAPQGHAHGADPAHLVGIVGMVLVIAGVVLGTRQSRRDPAAPSTGDARHAHR